MHAPTAPVNDVIEHLKCGPAAGGLTYAHTLTHTHRYTYTNTIALTNTHTHARRMCMQALGDIYMFKCIYKLDSIPAEQFAHAAKTEDCVPHTTFHSNFTAANETANEPRAHRSPQTAPETLEHAGEQHSLKSTHKHSAHTVRTPFINGTR